MNDADRGTDGSVSRYYGYLALLPCLCPYDGQQRPQVGTTRSEHNTSEWCTYDYSRSSGPSGGIVFLIRLMDALAIPFLSFSFDLPAVHMIERAVVPALSKPALHGWLLD